MSGRCCANAPNGRNGASFLAAASLAHLAFDFLHHVRHADLGKKLMRFAPMIASLSLLIETIINQAQVSVAVGDTFTIAEPLKNVDCTPDMCGCDSKMASLRIHQGQIPKAVGLAEGVAQFDVQRKRRIMSGLCLLKITQQVVD